MDAPGSRRALLLVENEPVPRDRRVWQEATSLRAAGWTVVVLGPLRYGSPQPRHEWIEGIEVHRFPLGRPRGGAGGWLLEYGGAMARIVARIRALTRVAPFTVIHAANPPDFLLLAALLQRRRGTALIFDQHDLMPEMAGQHFGRAARPLASALRVVERLAHTLADVSIAANASFREIAIRRGGVEAADVFVVRNGPRLDRFTEVPPDPSLSRGRPHLLVYEGIMGPTDGVDHAVRALGILRRRRDDWHAVFLGEGEALHGLRRLAKELGVEDRIDFPGYVSDVRLRAAICSASVCLAPDPRNPLTDVSTMIKVAEYMAMGRPIVSYPLSETRATAGDAAAYASANDPEDFARVIGDLLDDPARRERMGREGRRRVEQRFAWEYSELALHAAYERAIAKAATRSGTPSSSRATS